MQLQHLAATDAPDPRIRVHIGALRVRWKARTLGGDDACKKVNVCVEEGMCVCAFDASVCWINCGTWERYVEGTHQSSVIIKHP